MRRRLGSERGFTLIELMVSAMVGIVIIGGAFGLLDAVVRTFGTSGQRVDVSQRGRIAMDRITNRLRAQVCGGGPTAANPTAPYTATVEFATKDKVVFWSDLGDRIDTNGDGVINASDRDKRLRGVSFQGDTITALEYPVGATSSTATSPASRELIASVATANNGGLLRYWAFNPAAANPNTTPAPSLYIELTGNPMTPADLRRIVRITVGYTAYPERSTPADKSAADFTGDFLSRTAPSPYEFSEVPSDPSVLEPRCK